MKIYQYFTQQSPLVLASKSPQRADILNKLHLPFVAVPSNAEEIFNPADKIEKIAQDLALLKAEAIKEKYPKEIILGVDTFVVSETGEIITKPKNREDAREMILKKSNSVEIIISGVALVQGDKKLVKTEISKVNFATITPEDAEIILSFDEWQGRSGGFSIEGKTSFYIKGIEGDYWNIVGLPVYLLGQMLEEFIN